jgi:hypothetical protein
MTEHNVYELAQRVGCLNPDSKTSPGAEFLELVANYVEDIENEDHISELADSLVPVYTHHMWLTFVDLGAYNEDVTEFGPIEDLTKAAMVALYMIAHRLLSILWAEKGENENG